MASHVFTKAHQGLQTLAKAPWQQTSLCALCRHMLQPSVRTACAGSQPSHPVILQKNEAVPSGWLLCSWLVVAVGGNRGRRLSDRCSTALCESRTPWMQALPRVQASQLPAEQRTIHILVTVSECQVSRGLFHHHARMH